MFPDADRIIGYVTQVGFYHEDERQKPIHMKYIFTV